MGREEIMHTVFTQVIIWKVVNHEYQGVRVATCAVLGEIKSTN